LGKAKHAQHFFKTIMLGTAAPLPNLRKLQNRCFLKSVVLWDSEQSAPEQFAKMRMGVSPPLDEHLMH
jgi:hypothetical protein